MKKQLHIILFLFAFNTIHSQTTIFEDSFETYPDFTIQNFGDWVMYDVDQSNTWPVAECNYPNEGSPMSAIIFNPSQCTEDQLGPFEYTYGNYSILDGDKYVTFWCGGTGNDNYLVSPMIDLTNYSTASLSFFVKALTRPLNGFDPEHFEVLVSTASNSIPDLTFNLGDYTFTDCCTWHEMNYDLSAFSGEQIYIAIHHNSSINAYALHMDEFKVEGTQTASINDYSNMNFSFYPNPANNILNIKATTTIKRIKVINSIGQTIFDKEMDNLNTSINTSKFKSGIYFVLLQTKNYKEKFSFIKK